MHDYKIDFTLKIFFFIILLNVLKREKWSAPLFPLFPFFLNLKLQVSIHLQRLYRLVCVRNGLEPCRPVF